MANFTVEFARGTVPGPEYEDYNVTTTSICNSDSQPRTVIFNDNINGNFVVGWNYSGVVANTIRIESYLDEMYWIDTSNNDTVSVPGFIQSELKDGANIITYPYSMNIADIGNINIVPHSSELVCNESNKFHARRVRTISYYIFDTNNNPGPLRKAAFINEQE